MSRSDRRHEARRIKASAKRPWRQMHWPWATRGAKAGVKFIRKEMESAERARVRDDLKRGKEPEPRPTRHRGQYDLF